MSTTGKNSFFSRLMSSASGAAAPKPVVLVAPAANGGAPAGGEPDDAGPVPITEAAVESALEAAHAEGKVEGAEEGAQAEAARWNAVMSSDAGKASPALATFMLHANPKATAESLITHLAANPAAAAPVAAKPPVTNALSETPKVELTTDANNGDAGEQATDADIDKMYAASRDRLAASGAYSGAYALAPAAVAAAPSTGH